MLFKGRVAELMALIEPKLYRKYVFTNSKGESMLYVKLQKALYGLLRSALLFYKKLVADLKAYGFEVTHMIPALRTRW
jgi:hypothetical protein